ncbi:hypothetical protein FYK55_09795 [Roseiconus nitratireducens]|uniref:GTPase-associated protein 1 N-terminal domain-containing protein n=1 Tax=Roseiconus nitratireducens TaxID=2605748 RepID=A0A5M6DDS7_9BACT|nr:hypothetical protein [Roseiconus nitratireducens]KAA5544596.1 hypothetical protein FYK55_09795 [Roseiconus nitratireducens]
MDVGQITYGSVKRSRMKGYQIIGKSSTIDSNLAGSFCKWAPSHDSLEVAEGQSPQDAWALSFFPLVNDHFAVARTVHGGPEYSGRGGLSVVTSALIFSREQMESYQYDAIAIARTALTLGSLILPIGKEESLPEVTLPGKLLPLPAPRSDFIDSTPAMLPAHAVNWVAREASSMLRDDQKVMICGRCDPLPILTLLIDQLKPEERAEVSFACGLRSSSRRDFQVQFTHQALQPRSEKELSRSGICPIDLRRVLVAT